MTEGPVARAIGGALAWPHTKTILTYGLIVLLAPSLGSTLLAFVGSFSLGTLLRGSVPTLIYLALLVAVVTTDFARIRVGPAGGVGVSWRLVAVILGIAIAVAPAVAWLGSNIGMTYNVVILMILGLFLTAVVATLERRPIQGIVAFLLALPLLRFHEWELERWGLTSVAWGPVTLTPTLIFLLLLLGANLVSDVRSGAPASRSAVTSAVLFFLTALSLSIIVSPKRGESLGAFIFETAVPILLYFVLVRRVRTTEQAWLVAAAAAVSVFVQVFLAFYFYYKAIGTGIFNPEVAYGSVYEHPVLLQGSGRILASILIFPLALALLLSSRKRWHGVAWGGIAASLAAAVMMTQSRTGVLGLAAAAVPFLMARRAAARSAIVVGVGLIVVLVLMKRPFERFEEMRTIREAGLYGVSDVRYTAAIAALNMGREHPVFGMGYGMFGEFFVRYAGAVPSVYYTGGSVTLMQDAHNQYLTYFAEAGLLGVGSWLLVLGAAFWAASRAVKSARSAERALLARGCIGALAAVSVFGLFGGNPMSIGQGLTFWFVVGLVAALEPGGERERQEWGG